MRILFMCVANSARSQLAEGLARQILGPGHEIESAGSQPSRLNSYAVKALAEIGIDISRHFSKSVDSLPQQFIDQLDYVITLCAEEVCPALISKAKKLHWPFPDPAGHPDLPEEEQLQRFRAARDGIAEKFKAFKAQIGYA